MDEVHNGYFFGTCGKELHDWEDDRIIRGLKIWIKGKHESADVSKIFIKRVLWENPDGTINRNSFNMVVFGSPLTYNEMRIVFMNKDNRHFGFPVDADHGLDFNHLLDKDKPVGVYHRKLNYAAGLPSYIGLPVTVDIVRASLGKVLQVLHHQVTVPESLIKNKVLLGSADGYISHIPNKHLLLENKKGESEKKRKDLRFERKIQAYNFAHKLAGLGDLYVLKQVDKQRLIGSHLISYDDAVDGKVILTEECQLWAETNYYLEPRIQNAKREKVAVRLLTQTGQQFFGLHRLESECDLCGFPIKIVDINADLSFVHGKCHCDISKSSLKWENEKLVRYRVNKKHRVIFKPSFDNNSTLPNSLLVMVPRIRIDHDSPIGHLRSTIPSLVREQQHARWLTLRDNKCYAKLVRFKQHTVSEKYAYFFLELEVTRTEFWTEKTLSTLSNIRLKVTDPTLKDKYVDIDKKRSANGSWLSTIDKDSTSDGVFEKDDEVPPVEPDKLRFRMAARTKKSAVGKLIKNESYPCFPIESQYQRKTLQRLGNKWLRSFSRIEAQQLRATGALWDNQVVESSIERSKKRITLEIDLDEESTKKLGNWNPDLTTTSYVGFHAKFLATKFKDSEPEWLDVSGRVVHILNNPLIFSKIRVKAKFYLDQPWTTSFEIHDKADMMIRFFEHIALTQEEVTSLPCGIPAGAEGEIQTLADYEDDYMGDEFNEDAAANEWLQEMEKQDQDHSNVNGYEGFRKFKSAKVAEVQETCGVVHTRKFSRMRLPLLSTQDEILYKSMRYESSKDFFQFFDFLLKDYPNDVPRTNLSVNGVSKRIQADKHTDDILKDQNPSQREAATTVYNNRLSFVIGPPGCGKTTAGSDYILYISCQEKGTCYVLASSNLAADEMYQSLKKKIGKLDLKLKIIRMLSPKQEWRTKEGIDYLHQRVEEKAKTWTPEMRDLHTTARKYGKAFLPPRERMLLCVQNNRTAVDILSTMDIVVCTVGTATDGRLGSLTGLCLRRGIRPPIIAVDEASRVTIADIMPIMQMNPVRMMLLGDCSQLSPVVKNQEAIDSCLDIPFMKLFEMKPYYNKISCMLNETYRMSPQICKLISNTTYDGQVKTSKYINDRESKPEVQELYQKLWKYFPGTSGKNFALCSYPDTNQDGPKDKKSTSKYNLLEANKTMEVLRTLLTKCGTQSSQIRIICMYKAQVKLVQKMIEQDHTMKGVIVSTVDAAQGTESDIIIINGVRSNLKYDQGFLDAPERWNVALSRARHFVICIMDFKCFMKSNTPTSKLYVNEFYKLGILPQELCAESFEKQFLDKYLKGNQ